MMPVSGRIHESGKRKPTLSSEGFYFGARFKVCTRPVWEILFGIGIINAAIIFFIFITANIDNGVVVGIRYEVIQALHLLIPSLSVTNEGQKPSTVKINFIRIDLGDM